VRTWPPRPLSAPVTRRGAPQGAERRCSEHPGTWDGSPALRFAWTARGWSSGPGDEFLIAAVGPLTSLLVAALFWIVDVFARGVLPGSLIGMFGYLAWVNLLLAAFNLVPGFPLDGGRLLRSFVWRVTGSFRRATRIASLAGQAVGWLLVAGGVAFLLTGNLAGGIWFAFIGADPAGSDPAGRRGPLLHAL